MMAMPHSSTDYPAVRWVMDDDAVESVLAELFPDSDPGDVESFLGTLQRFGNEVVPIAARVLPGAVQGAVTGAGVGGPYGLWLVSRFDWPVLANNGWSSARTT